MKEKLFKLITRINQEGIDNGVWGTAEDVNSDYYFGGRTDKHFEKIIYLWWEDETYNIIDEIMPDCIVHTENNELIAIYYWEE